MKPLSIICIIVLLAALVGPFFIKVGGKPIMTLDDLVPDAVPAALSTPTEVYRWQDANGRWHFSEAAPADGTAERLTVDDKITRMDDGWHVKPLTGDGGRSAVKLTAPGIAGYVQGGAQLMDKANIEVDKLNERVTEMEALRRSVN